MSASPRSPDTFAAVLKVATQAGKVKGQNLARAAMATKTTLEANRPEVRKVQSIIAGISRIIQKRFDDNPDLNTVEFKKEKGNARMVFLRNRKEEVVGALMKGRRTARRKPLPQAVPELLYFLYPLDGFTVVFKLLDETDVSTHTIQFTVDGKRVAYSISREDREDTAYSSLRLLATARRFQTLFTMLLDVC